MIFKSQEGLVVVGMVVVVVVVVSSRLIELECHDSITDISSTLEMHSFAEILGDREAFGFGDAFQGLFELCLGGRIQVQYFGMVIQDVRVNVSLQILGFVFAFGDIGIDPYRLGVGPLNMMGKELSKPLLTFGIGEMGQVFQKNESLVVVWHECRLGG